MKTNIILLKLFFLAINKFCFLFNKLKINIMNNKKGARALDDIKIFLKFICCFNAIILSKLVSIHNQIAKNRNIYICLFII